MFLDIRDFTAFSHSYLAPQPAECGTSGCGLDPTMGERLLSAIARRVRAPPTADHA
jgi:hypothetical protein